jgi:NADH dehydrogenase [ubiquinone] 1 alpha subcomplex assembly factor 5
MTGSEPIFNQKLHHARQARAKARFAEYDFLHQAIAERVIERVEDIRRNFNRVLLVGDGQGVMRQQLLASDKVEKVVEATIEGAQEALTPEQGGSFDMVVGFLDLQWINDLPGVLAQMAGQLPPDGVVLGAVLGGETLLELRQSLMQAEEELSGRVSARIAPMVEVRAMGGLLQRAGLAMPMTDTERITVTYENILKLMHDLRGMGMSNAMASQPPPLTRTLLERTEAHYREEFSDDGRLQVTFDAVMFTGWKPDASQPQPAKRGSGQVSLGELFSEGLLKD